MRQDTSGYNYRPKILDRIAIFLKIDGKQVVTLCELLHDRNDPTQTGVDK
jgi:hypothetical protein